MINNDAARRAAEAAAREAARRAAEAAAKKAAAAAAKKSAEAAAKKLSKPTVDAASRRQATSALSKQAGQKPSASAVRQSFGKDELSRGRGRALRERAPNALGSPTPSAPTPGGRTMSLTELKASQSRSSSAAFMKDPDAPKRPAVSTNVSGTVNTGGPEISGSHSTSVDSTSCSASTSGNIGGVDTHASVSGPAFQFNAEEHHSIGLSGVDVQLEVDISATAVSASADATRSINFTIGGEHYTATVDLGAQGTVGADGHINLDLHLGTDGSVSISSSAEGFAGVKASITGGVTLSHEGHEMAQGSITLSASAGVSGEAHANIGLDGGTVHFDVGAEATAGVGLGVDVEGSVNVVNTLEAIGETVVGLGGEILKHAGEEVLHAGGALLHGAEEVISFLNPLDW